MPGVPMVFAGDEVGVGGSTSDSGRKPFPWDESTWDHDLLATYRQLIALRRGVDALRRGGMRFVAASEEAIAFVHETVDETLLVHASRGPTKRCRSAGVISASRVPPSGSTGRAT